MPGETVSQFLQELIAWAGTQPAIQALALVGSYARNAATEGSDADLVMLVGSPEIYVQDTSWARQFGSVEREQTEDYGKLISIRVWYAGGLEIEYGISDPGWAALPLDAGSQRVISDGMRVLFEREPLLSRHQQK